MELSLIVAAIAGGWFWLNSLSARELAISHGRALAEKCQLQLLDETVACVKLRLKRNSRGHLVFYRTYAFDVSANGADRLACHLDLLGQQLLDWHIPPYQQPNLYIVH